MPITGPAQELLHSRRFRLLYGGYLASTATDGLIPIVFAVEALHSSGSPWTLSTVLIALWLGRFLVVPLSGRLAATRNPAGVMIAADLIRITAQAGLILYVSLTANSAAAMAISAFVYGFGAGIYMPAQRTVLPALVAPTALGKANAAFSAATDVSLIAGPALGVAAMHLVGFRGVLAADCLTFAVNIVALLRLTAVCRADGVDLTTVPDDSTAVDAAAPAGTLRTAWQLSRTDRFLGVSLLFWALASVLIGMIAVYGPSRIIGTSGGAGAWAAISTVMALSSLAGSLSAAFGGRLSYRAGIVAVTALLLLQILVFAAGFSAGGMLLVTFAVCGGGALMVTWSGIQWITAVQQRLEHAELGRFFAVESALTAVGAPVGMALGPLLATGGGGWLIAGLGLALFTAAVTVARTPARRIDYATT